MTPVPQYHKIIIIVIIIIKIKINAVWNPSNTEAPFTYSGHHQF
jgi:hypothetical protein